MNRREDARLLDSFNQRLAAIDAEVPAPPRWRGSVTTRDPRRRLQSLFSVTRTVVAGAIVALFGGFVLAGLLSTQPSEDRLPAAGESASASTDPTATDDGLAALDLLPGVDLALEEVEPGVFRVVSDGVRDLARVVERSGPIQSGIGRGNIAAGLDGSVWWFGRDDFFRLGDAATHAWSESELVDGVSWGEDLGVTPEGTLLRYSDPEHAMAFDGRSWTEREVVPTQPAVWLKGGLRVFDGEYFETLITAFAAPTIDRAAVGADGTIWISAAIGDDFTVLARYGLYDAEPAFQEWREFSRDLPLLRDNVFEVASDGSLWFAPSGDYETTGSDCDGIARFDGETVTHFLRDTCVFNMDIAPDGRFWLQAGTSNQDPSSSIATTIHTYVITPQALLAAE